MSLNRIQLLGNVGKDPEVRHLDSGVAVAQLTLATTVKGYTTQSGQQMPERTEWHNLVAWRGLAQTIEKYVKKGNKLYVEGEMRYRSYEGQDGVTRRSAEVYVDRMEMLTPKSESRPLSPMPQQTASPQPQQPQATAPWNEPHNQPIAQQPAPQPQQQQLDLSAEPGDDLPF